VRKAHGDLQVADSCDVSMLLMCIDRLDVSESAVTRDKMMIFWTFLCVYAPVGGSGVRHNTNCEELLQTSRNEK